MKARVALVALICAGGCARPAISQEGLSIVGEFVLLQDRLAPFPERDVEVRHAFQLTLYGRNQVRGVFQATGRQGWRAGENSGALGDGRGWRVLPGNRISYRQRLRGGLRSVTVSVSSEDQCALSVRYTLGSGSEAFAFPRLQGRGSALVNNIRVISARCAVQGRKSASALNSGHRS